MKICLPENILNQTMLSEAEFEEKLGKILENAGYTVDEGWLEFHPGSISMLNTDHDDKPLELSENS